MCSRKYHDLERLIAALHKHLEFPLEKLWDALNEQPNDTLVRLERLLCNKSDITAHVIRYLMRCISDDRRVELLHMMSEQPTLRRRKESDHGYRVPKDH